MKKEVEHKDLKIFFKKFVHFDVKICLHEFKVVSLAKHTHHLLHRQIKVPEIA